MASELTRAIFALLTPDQPVTPAGAAHLLRNDFLPAPVIDETERSLDFLARYGYAKRIGEGEFGPEYVRA